MLRFCMALTGTLHERIVRPSESTVHAPHCDRPQPNFGPFNRKSFRRTYSSGVLRSASMARVLPFTVSEIRGIATTSLFRGRNRRVLQFAAWSCNSLYIFQNEFQRNLSHLWVHPAEPDSRIRQSTSSYGSSSQFAKRFRIALMKVYLECSAISSCRHSGRKLLAPRIIPPFPSQPKSIRQRWIFRSQFSAGQKVLISSRYPGH